MKAIRPLFLMTALFALALAAAGASSAAARPAEPWRVIYIEGGNFRNYYLSLVGLAHGLSGLGLIDNGDVPAQPGTEDSETIWKWLAHNAGGDRLRFLEDGYYSAGWDEERRAEIKRTVLERLRRDEVDLILALGTSAGQDFVTNEHQTPVLSISTTDPLAAGISLSPEDSGLDHAHVQVERGRIKRQLAMFYSIFKFRRLGVPLDSSFDGQKTLGAATINAVAREQGFEIVPCLSEMEIADYERSFENLMSCLEYLCTRTDAIYLTFNNGMQENRMDRILAPILAAKLPTFSQKGPSETRLGVLMSLAEDDLTSAGRFEAEVVKKILDGQKPRDINQLYVAPLTMALNLKMALAIGWNPPFEILAAVDELYNEIAGQE